MQVPLLLLLLFGLVNAARAQEGRLGMKTWQLQAQLGAPHRIDRIDSDKPWLFKGRDEVWFYSGRDGKTSFSYGIDEGIVYSATAMTCGNDRAAAEQRVAQEVAAREQNGWDVEEQAGHRYVLQDAATVLTIDLLEEQDAYCIAVARVHRAFVGGAHGRGIDRASALGRLLAFHDAHATSAPSGPASSTAALLAVRTAALPVAPKEEAQRGHDPAPARPQPESTPPPEAAVEDEKGIVPAQGGYTWVVASVSSRQEAAAMARDYQQRGLRCGVFEGSAAGRKVYRVGVGQYGTLEALQAARQPLPPEAPPDTWPLRLAQGGYTWVIASVSSEQEAAAIAQFYREEGFQASVFKGSAGGKDVYRVGVGQYDTLEALQAARQPLPPEAPPDAWPLRLAQGM